MPFKIDYVSVALKKIIDSLKFFFERYYYSVIFTIVIYAAVVLFGIIGYFIYDTQSKIILIEKRAFSLAGLSNEIIYLDEVLTMSARLAAYTEDLKWKERYKSHEAQLDSAIKMVMELSAERIMLDAIAQTDTANIKLVAMEKLSFDLTMQGNNDSAISILFSKDYDENKEIYAKGIDRIVRASSEYLTATLNRLHKKSLFTYMSVSIFVPILLFSWFVGQRYYKRLLITKNILNESEKLYRILFEDSSDAIMILDKDCFIDCNDATLRIFGLSDKTEFIGTHPADLSPPHQANGEDSLTAANRKISEAIQKGTNQFEWVHRRKNGEDFFADVLLTASRIGDREIIQATVRDLSVRKRLEEEIAERNRLEAIQNMIVTLNHEMNQPLSVICSYSNCLLEDVEKDSEAYEDVRIINDEAWKLAALVRKTTNIKTAKTTKYSPGIDMIDLDQSPGGTKDK